MPSRDGATSPSAATKVSKPSTPLQPVVRALHALQTVAAAGSGLTLQAISEALGVPTPSTHRVLAVLESERFIVRSPTTRRYFIGPAALELSSPGGPTSSQLIPPHPELRRLASATAETVFVTELQGDRAVCVSLVDGSHPLRLFVRVGQEMPLHAAASARVLLAGLDDRRASELLARRPLNSFTQDTPASIPEVLRHLRQVRQRGYDICDNELDHGVWAVAAPVRQANGQVCASVTLAAPKQRIMTSWDERRATDAVIAAANHAAADLGWLPAAD